MSSYKLVRTVIFYLLYVCVCGQKCISELDVNIQALEPRGIRILVTNILNANILVVKGNVNKDIIFTEAPNEVDIYVYKQMPNNGSVTFEKNNIELNLGDKVHCYVNVITYNEEIYFKKITFTIKEFFDPSEKITSRRKCYPSLTLVPDKTVCPGEIIFEDDFNELREDLWQVEQYIPDEPDFPFVSYQRPYLAPTVRVSSGNLVIEPKMQQGLTGYSTDEITSGTLDLFSGCTGRSMKCKFDAYGASILPPIASGKLTTRKFAFTYGVVEIRAKLPQGDWLYPDILLEPLLKKYGDANYASGIIRLAGALGNDHLSNGTKEFGNKVLYGGAIMSLKCREKLLRYKPSQRSWGEQFHVYTVRWTPDQIIFFVDDEEWATITTTEGDMKKHFEDFCEIPKNSLGFGSKMAPFDDYFSLTLGVAAGGITEFPDYVSDTKPWKNRSRKAVLKFWQDLNSWLPTWKQPALIVDYVRVRAL